MDEIAYRAQIARVVAQPLAYRVSDASAILGIGRTMVFEMIRDGRLDAKKIGAATVVTHASIERLFHKAEWAKATKRTQARQ